LPKVDDNVTRALQRPASARRATIRDVARAAAVSTVTVSRVVNAPARVQHETRERVARAMAELGYVPNAAARSMRTRATRSVGCLVPDLVNYPNAAIAQAAERHLAAAGYALLLANSDYDSTAEVRAIAALTAQGVDALLLYVSDESDSELQRAVARLDVPHLVLDRRLAGDGDRLLSDHATAMHEVVRYLVGLGHGRLALLVSTLRIRPVDERIAAFLEAGAALGLARSDLAVVRVRPDDAERLRAAQELLAAARRPTAVLADGGRQVRGVLAAARLQRLLIPDHVSLVGLDAGDIATVMTPALTTVERDYIEIGRLAADLLLSRLAEPDQPPRRLILGSEVVLRGSCAPPGGTSRALARAD
jgi:DNA-binding LacI/PurR family transcriptional regulator